MKVSKLISFIWRTSTGCLSCLGATRRSPVRHDSYLRLKYLECFFPAVEYFLTKSKSYLTHFDQNREQTFQPKGTSVRLKSTHLKSKSKNFAVCWRHAIFSPLRALVTVQFMFNLQQALPTLRMKAGRKSLQLKNFHCLLNVILSP